MVDQNQTVCLYVGTSVVYSLFPQDPLQVLGPGLLHFPSNCLQCVCVLTFPLSEPDLKTQATVTGVLGHAYVRRLDAKSKVLVSNTASSL